MIDLLFLAHNRLAFTEASLETLIRNTDLTKFRRLWFYDDHSLDGTREYLHDRVKDIPRAELVRGSFGGPVAVMNDYLSGLDALEDSLFVKIDNDTIVPPGWLEICRRLMAEHGDTHLLGIEAMHAIGSDSAMRSVEAASFIGGIGFMRNRAFVTLPRPSGRFGFTAWQQKSDWVKAAWIVPSLRVFLLDRVPEEPWHSLSAEYVARGWQRDWPGRYQPSQRAMWDWWHPGVPRP